VQGAHIKSGGREVILLVDPATDKPVQMDFTKDGKPDFSIRYLSYETDLPFGPSLFEPPQGSRSPNRSDRNRKAFHEEA
jgi:hypothetical protein